MSWYLEQDLKTKYLKEIEEERSTTLLERRYLQNYSLARKEIYDKCKDYISELMYT